MSTFSSLRILDKIYIGYFVLHIFITLLVDLQSWYPQHLVPDVLKQINTFYLAQSGDPLVANTLGDDAQLAWFNTFSALEAFFQLPAFFIGIYGLLNRSKAVYILVLAYGASTATTVLPCLTTMLKVPTTHIDLPTGTVSVTEEQRMFMIFNYLPFLFMPVLMAIDSSFRLASFIEPKTKTQ